MPIKILELVFDENHFNIEDTKGLQTQLKTVNGNDLHGDGDVVIAASDVDKKYVDEQVALKQDNLISGTNIKTINGQTILGSGDLPVSGGGDYQLTAEKLMAVLESDEFYLTEGNGKVGNGPWGANSPLNNIITKDTEYTDLTTTNKSLIGAINELQQSLLNAQQLLRLKALLNQAAFGINSETKELQYEGQFSKQTVYNGQDKPEDNMVTDDAGVALDIRMREDLQDNQNAWYTEDGMVILENAEGKLNYFGNEIGIKQWHNFDVTNTDTTLKGEFEVGTKYRCWIIVQDMSMFEIEFIWAYTPSNQQVTIASYPYAVDDLITLTKTDATTVTLKSSKSTMVKFTNLTGETFDATVFAQSSRVQTAFPVDQQYADNIKTLKIETACSSGQTIQQIWEQYFTETAIKEHLTQQVNQEFANGFDMTRLKTTKVEWRYRKSTVGTWNWSWAVKSMSDRCPCTGEQSNTEHTKYTYGYRWTFTYGTVSGTLWEWKTAKMGVDDEINLESKSTK